ncbi:MAG: acylphosphatase [Pseudomonadota bacterium]
MQYIVSGRVQGVYYRASTQGEARRLGLRGYVRNLADGRVEVVACGGDAALRSLEHWLWKGPDLAAVTAVEAHARPSECFDGFTISY